MEIRVARWCKIERGIIKNPGNKEGKEQTLFYRVHSTQRKREKFISYLSVEQRKIWLLRKKWKTKNRSLGWWALGLKWPIVTSFLALFSLDSTWRWWTGPPLMIVCAQGPLGFFIASSLKEWKDFCTFSIAKPTWDAEVGGGGRRCWIAWAWLKA